MIPRHIGIDTSTLVRLSSGPGLFDRLISNDYSRSGLETLTLDRQMASLSGAQLL